MDWDLRNECEKLTKMTLHVAHRLPKPWAPLNEEWTDIKLRYLRRGCYFRHSAYSRKELKKILIRFYSFYCRGCIEAGDNVAATLNDVIAIAQTDLGPIWKAAPPNTKAFYIPNMSQNAKVNIPNGGMMRNQDLIGCFWSHVVGIIKYINPFSLATAEETRLIRLTSFLALTLYRFATNSSREIAKTFMETEYRNDLISLAGWPALSVFSPPCDLCLKVCEEAMGKGLLNTSKVFTIVVNEYVDSNSVNYVNTSARKMLTATLLNDTALIGLELVQMMEKAAVILDIEWRALLNETYFMRTRSSWERIANFFVSQNNIKNPQYSFYWAKIIDHSYFRELALKENLFLATIFSAIIAEVEGQVVWEAEWARGTVLCKDAKSIGQALYKESIPGSDQLIRACAQKK